MLKIEFIMKVPFGNAIEVEDFARERLRLTDKTITLMLDELREAIHLWEPIIEKSFLPSGKKRPTAVSLPNERIDCSAKKHQLLSRDYLGEFLPVFIGSTP